MSLLSRKLLGVGVSTDADPYYNNVSLLTNFENNIAFRDDSTNKFAITRAGITRPSLETPFSSVGGSIHFNGSSSLILTGQQNNAAFSLPGDFTIELWVYLSVASTGTAFYAGNDAATTGGYGFIYNNGTIGFNTRGYTGTSIGSTLDINTWTHLAVVRSGTTLSFYKNGVLAQSATVSITLTPNADPTIGQNNRGSLQYYWNGFISNVRVVKDTALYTSNFTPTTIPLTAIPGTSLLITGTGQGMFDNSTFVDQGRNALTVTAASGTVYAGLSPFGSAGRGSIKFNGTTSSLSAAASSAYVFSTSSFTVEAWIYILADGATNSGGNRDAVIFRNATSGNVSFQFMLTGNTTTSGVGLGLYSSSGMNVSANFSFAKTTWYHVAATRDGSSIKFFVNGTQIGTTQTSSTSIGSASYTMEVGGSSYSGYADRLNGHISNARIVAGTAIYTSNFTPPTKPLTNIAGTVLLIRGDTGAFYDLSKNGSEYTVQTGSPVLSTQILKYGTTAGFLPSGTRLNVAPNSNRSCTGDFTFEFWFWSASPTTTYANPMVVNRTSVAGDFQFYAGSTVGSNKGTLAINSVTFTNGGITPNAVHTSSWQHLAMVRSGSTVTLYQNGTAFDTATYSGVVDFGSTVNLLFGAWNNNASDNLWQGYLDDIRLTRGVARYTANFTPPTKTFLTS